MYDPRANFNSLATVSILFSEFIGTAILLIVVNWSAASGEKGGVSFQPFAIALTIFALIVQLGPISGGMFNPAVTLGLYIKKFGEKPGTNFRNANWMVLIILTQILGGFFGCLIVYWCLSKSIDKDESSGILVPTIAVLCPPVSSYKADGVEFDLCDPYTFSWQVFATEAICTFLFVSTVISVVHHMGQSTLAQDALTVSLGILAAIIAAMGISGGCINPAVGFTQTVF